MLCDDADAVEFLDFDDELVVDGHLTDEAILVWFERRSSLIFWQRRRLCPACSGFPNLHVQLARCLFVEIGGCDKEFFEPSVLLRILRRAFRNIRVAFACHPSQNVNVERGVSFVRSNPHDEEAARLRADAVNRFQLLRRHRHQIELLVCQFVTGARQLFVIAGLRVTSAFLNQFDSETAHHGEWQLAFPEREALFDCGQKCSGRFVSEVRGLSSDDDAIKQFGLSILFDGIHIFDGAAGARR